jgi:UDP-N-acetylmuramoyl-L-alanyl-D-glutamate--2,6-diaminopimelate ligase
MLAQFLYTVKRPYHFVKTGLLNGLLSQIRYGFPQRKLKIITITGTDGKTTSSTLLYHVLKAAGKQVGLISTVGAYLGDQPLDTGFHVTAPQPNQIYKLMRQMISQGFEYLILETTSHGIYQYRTWGIKPEIAGLTNITHEHLDYHVTYENYLMAKVSLLQRAKKAVINADDESYPLVKKELKYHETEVIEYSHDQSLPPSLRQAMMARFTQAFNFMNTRMVIKMAQELGLSNQEIAQGIETFPEIPGRMQFIPTKKGFQVAIDFAHTPQGLQEALKALRKQMHKEGLNGRLIALFGCASQRDRSKRPVMTQLAVELADLVILTAEDPRFEDIWAIIREMKEQLTVGHQKVMSIADRREAIEFALTHLAKKGDVIGIFGKGHETSMNYRGVEMPWNDAQVVNEVLFGGGNSSQSVENDSYASI